jgi:hypothetical protein
VILELLTVLDRPKVVQRRGNLLQIGGQFPVACGSRPRHHRQLKEAPQDDFTRVGVSESSTIARRRTFRPMLLQGSRYDHLKVLSRGGQPSIEFPVSPALSPICAVSLPPTNKHRDQDRKHGANRLDAAPDRIPVWARLNDLDWKGHAADAATIPAGAT